MAKMKKNKKYYFTVEGETEHWYLKWLENLINSTDKSKLKVSIDCPVQKNPEKRVKSMTITSKTSIYHLSDYESDDPEHFAQFIKTMDNMKNAQRLGRDVKYFFGYSNLAFDLWIVLHKINCNSFKTHRSHYLSDINRAFSESFESMSEYKEEDNFKRCLSRLDLEDVVSAILRSKAIMEKNKNNGYVLHEYKGFHYYKENPSLFVWVPIEQILKDCNLI